MSDNDPAQPGDRTVPDPDDGVNTDLTSSVGAEDFDEDRLQLDPLEEAMDPPERWSAADRYGITAAEQRDGESLEQRLDQEQPDPALTDDDAADDQDYAVAQGVSADVAGGSVAESLRQPDVDEDQGENS